MKLVGRYEILRQLGEGGMATVYLARQPKLERLVALKELRLMSSCDPSFIKRFLREARTGGSLSHPNRGNPAADPRQSLATKRATAAARCPRRRRADYAAA